MIKPVLLARPCGLAEGSGDRRVDPAVGLMIRAVGARDLAIGLAMAAAPRGTALQAALGARVFSDAADVVMFGTQLPDPGRRLRIAGFAAFWAALCAYSGRWSR